MLWQSQRFKLDLSRPLIMGIVNVTPDSFSDGGHYFDPASAIEHAHQLCKQGADIIDLGAESTRPYATSVDQEEEWRRLAPVLQELLKWNIPLSVDTYKPSIMQKALDKGADFINDIYALRWTSPVQALSGIEVLSAYPQAGVCLMHMHGTPDAMQKSPMSSTQEACVQEVMAFFKARLAYWQQHELSLDRVIVDPGIGFGKTPEQNLLWLQAQDLEQQVGRPWLAAWSRKSTLGLLTQQEKPSDRIASSLAAALLSLQAGARILRVHDVAFTKEALKVWLAAKSVTITD